MGQEISHSIFEPQDFEEFSRRVRSETSLLQQWHDDGVLQAEERMAGSEVEAWLVDAHGLPAPVNQPFLQDLDNPLVVPELSRFNVELNTRPRYFGAGMFDQMHEELASLWLDCEAAASRHAAHMLMIGILPTIEQTALSLDNISALQRYQALNEQVLRMRNGKPLQLDIRGIQHLQVSHDDVMLEAAATSLQIHFKVDAKDAVDAYNISKILSAPMVAVSSNAPYLFGRDLWSETRIPLFEQAVSVGASDYSKRVTFGIRYARDSIMECFEANRDRYPVLLPHLMDVAEDELAHLRLHNGTIWRWNRPLIGFSETGQPHLRIEHRVASSGPSSMDMIANTAFYFGALIELMASEKQAISRLPFEVAHANFYHSARLGLDAEVGWFDGQQGNLRELCLDRLLPLAERGLLRMGVSVEEAGRWLAVVRERLQTGQTGTAWQRAWVARHGADFEGLVQDYRERQLQNLPVHQWAV